jgi:hypothetical protein
VKRMLRPVRAAALTTALCTAVCTAILQPGIAEAHPASQSQVQTTISVVADGLNTPRGVAWDAANHRVLVAEAGTGAESNTAPCGPASGGSIYCLGATGSIYSYDGHHGKRIVTGLPSISHANAAGTKTAVLGVHDLTVNRDGMQVVFGLSGDGPFRTALGNGGKALGQTATIDKHGKVKPVGDLLYFEMFNNPHPSEFDSDPYGLAQTSRYGTVVADAAGNDILQVKPNGTVKLLAEFPTRVPDANPADIIEDVPTSVVQGPDGALYVGELSGYPYYPHEAVVYRVVPGQTPTVFARGFTNISDIGFDDHGRLLVLEMAKNGLLDPDQTGRFVRVESNGTQTDLATTGLTNPGGFVSAGHGVYYVTNGTNTVGGAGQLLKLTVSG